MHAQAVVMLSDGTEASTISTPGPRDRDLQPPHAVVEFSSANVIRPLPDASPEPGREAEDVEATLSRASLTDGAETEANRRAVDRGARRPPSSSVAVRSAHTAPSAVETEPSPSASTCGRTWTVGISAMSTT